MVSLFLRDLISIEVQNTLDDTGLTKETTHGVPGEVLLAHHYQYTLQHITDSIWRHSETFDLIEILSAKLTYGCLCSIYLWLNAGELALDVYLSLLDDLLVLSAASLKHLDLLFRTGTLL